MALVVGIGFRLQREGLRWGLLVTEVGLILLPALVFAGLAGELKALGRRGHLLGRDVPGLLLLGVATFVASIAAGIIFVVALRLIGVTVATPNITGALLQGATPAKLAATFVLSCLLAPLCEETLFRGTMQTTLRRVTGPLLAVLVPAVAFAAFHVSLLRFAPAFALGLAAGCVRERYDSLWAAVLIHAVVNALGLSLAFVKLGLSGA